LRSLISICHDLRNPQEHEYGKKLSKIEKVINRSVKDDIDKDVSRRSDTSGSGSLYTEKSDRKISISSKREFEGTTTQEGDMSYYVKPFFFLHYFFFC